MCSNLRGVAPCSTPPSRPAHRGADFSARRDTRNRGGIHAGANIHRECVAGKERERERWWESPILQARARIRRIEFWLAPRKIVMRARTVTDSIFASKLQLPRRHNNTAKPRIFVFGLRDRRSRSRAPTPHRPASLFPASLFLPGACFSAACFRSPPLPRPRRLCLPVFFPRFREPLVDATSSRRAIDYRWSGKTQTRFY